jgi:hypothetical protein
LSSPTLRGRCWNAISITRQSLVWLSSPEA